MDLYLYYAPSTDGAAKGRWQGMRRKDAKFHRRPQKPAPSKAAPILFLTGKYSTDIEQETSVLLSTTILENIALAKRRYSYHTGQSPKGRTQPASPGLHRNGSAFCVTSFQISDWCTLPISPKVTEKGEQHQYFSQVQALLQSMQYQYPNKSYYARTPLAVLLEIYRRSLTIPARSNQKLAWVPSSANQNKRTSIEAPNQLDKEGVTLQTVLDAWTDEHFILIVVQVESATGLISARQVVSPHESNDGDYLFLNYTVNPPDELDRRPCGEWHAMERKPGVKQRP